MATANEMIKRLESINMLDEVVEAFNKHADVAAEFNRDQLDIGQKGDGSFNRDYSDTSVYVYGKRPGPIRLYDTGAFWRGINYRADKVRNTIISDSSDWKVDKLEKEYGEEILQLTDFHKADLIHDYVAPDLFKSISNKTGIQ